MDTSTSFHLKCNTPNPKNNVDVDQTGAYLRLRKDNLAIPKEFYVDNSKVLKEDATLTNYDENFSIVKRSSKFPMVPPLKLPRNSVEDWNQKLKIEKIKNDKPPSPTPSES